MPHPKHGQFLRVEKFAVAAPYRKQGGNTIDKVAHEASRTEGYCPHVSRPSAPVLRYGVPPLVAAQRAKSWANMQEASYLHKQSQTQKRRKFRDDRAAALVGVISAPTEWVLGERWNELTTACIDFLKNKYGSGRLTTVIEHHDEPCLHLHFWVLPLATESFSAVHDGERAIQRVWLGAPRVVRDAAYKGAMSKLLDDFHHEVGCKFGFERETVSLSRTSRQQWLKEKWLREQREKEIQHRIDVAVAEAIEKFKADQTHFQQIRDENATATKVVANSPSRTSSSDRLRNQLSISPIFQRYQFPDVSDAHAQMKADASAITNPNDESDAGVGVYARDR